MADSSESRAFGHHHHVSGTGPGLVHDRSQCIFCRIVDGTDPASGRDKIIYQNEELTVFADIRPVAKYHFLVVTNQHIRDSTCLTRSHIGLLGRMTAMGNRVFVNAFTADSPGFRPPKPLIGFHLPPYLTVHHLHLHIIAPVETIRLSERHLFRPNSYIFVRPNWIKRRLQETWTNRRSYGQGQCA